MAFKLVKKLLDDNVWKMWKNLAGTTILKCNMKDEYLLGERGENDEEMILWKECKWNKIQNNVRQEREVRRVKEATPRGEETPRLLECTANHSWILGLQEPWPCQESPHELFWLPIDKGNNPSCTVRIPTAQESEVSSWSCSIDGELGRPQIQSETKITPTEPKAIEITPVPGTDFIIDPNQEYFNVICFVRRSFPVPLVNLTTMANNQLIPIEIVALNVDENIFFPGTFDLFVEFRVNHSLLIDSNPLELTLTLEQLVFDTKIFLITARREAIGLSPGLLALVIILSLLVLFGTGAGLLICYKKHLLCFEVLSKHDDLQRQIASPNTITFPRFHPNKKEPKELHYVPGIEFQTITNGSQNFETGSRPFQLNEYDDEPDFLQVGQVEPPVRDYVLMCSSSLNSLDNIPYDEVNYMRTIDIDKHSSEVADELQWKSLPTRQSLKSQESEC